MNITIIGSGPSVVPLLSEIQQQKLSANITIISPGKLGVGCHKIELGEYCQLNTISSEVNMSPCSSRKYGVASLYEWAEKKQKQWPENMNGGGRESLRLSVFDHFPRAWLGEYSHDIAVALVDDIQQFGSVTCIDGIVEDICHDSVIYRSDKKVQSVKTDVVLLATGHGIQVDQPADAVPDNGTLAIKGVGLSAVDMLYAVTVGKGGKFMGSGFDTQYIPSGREPAITMSSASKKPFRYRPLISKNEPEHICYFMSSAHTEHIDQYSSWEDDILPLVYLDISLNHLYHQYWVSNEYSKMEAILEHVKNNHYVTLKELSLNHSFYNLIDSVLNPINFRIDSHYHQDVIDFIESDLNEARKGLYGSSLKFSIEIFRSLRDEIRSLFSKIKDNKQEAEYFFKKINPMMNRNVICHQIERGFESIALSRSGILTFVPESTNADYEINGFVNHDKQILFDNLKEKGVEFISYMYNRIKTDANNKICSPYFLGYAIGPVTEGNSYYNHYVSGGKTPSHLEEQAKMIIHSLMKETVS